MRLQWIVRKTVWGQRALTRGVVVAALGAGVFAMPHQASAQVRERFRERRQEHQERQEQRKQQRQQDKGNAKNPNRTVLEKQYRVRAESVVRTRLNLSDDQLTKLRGVNAHFAGRRRDLVQQEGMKRRALNTELARGKGADQKRVKELMNQVQGLEQQRMQLQTQERSEVSQFLNPVQQAQYFGFQERVRKRAKELQKGGEQ